MITGPAKYLPGGTERKLKLERLLDRAADHHRPIGRLKGDFLESGRLELGSDEVGVRHRERTGATGLRVLARRRQELEHDGLRYADPGIVLARLVTNISRPRGFSALEILRIATTGLLKNIMPNRALLASAVMAEPVLRSAWYASAHIVDDPDEKPDRDCAPQHRHQRGLGIEQPHCRIDEAKQNDHQLQRAGSHGEILACKRASA